MLTLYVFRHTIIDILKTLTNEDTRQMTSTTLKAIVKMLAENGIEIKNTKEDKNALTSLIITTVHKSGVSLNDSIDFVLGKGTSDNLVDSLYTTLSK